MLRLDIVDFIEDFNSQLMQLTRFKILEFKALIPLLCSTWFWGQPGGISLFVSCFFLFRTHEQFTISLKYSRNRIYSCHLTPVYINFRSDTYKLYPRYLLADVLKICKTARQEAVYELGFSSLESCLFPSLVFIWLMMYDHKFMHFRHCLGLTGWLRILNNFYYHLVSY